VFAPPPEFALSTATGALALALGDELQGVLLAPLLAALRDRAPGIDLRARRVSAAPVDGGRRGLLDIEIAPDLSAPPPIARAVYTSELVSRPLYERTWTVEAWREGWRAPVCGSASLPPIDLGTWLAADHAIVSYEGCGGGFVDELLAARGLHRRVVASVTSFPEAPELVARSRVLAVVPSELVGPHTCCGTRARPPNPGIGRCARW
jgi:DNA-binding transcriptional LysR family regulator